MTRLLWLRARIFLGHAIVDLAEAVAWLGAHGASASLCRAARAVMPDPR